jgi:amino-acid N-acetyltransferase
LNEVSTAVMRKARVADVPLIAEIVNRQAQKGLMLPRPLAWIYDNIRDFMVADVDGEVVGCGALHVMWLDLAEIRGLALREDLMGKGFGRKIVESLLGEAHELGIERVFVLTYKDKFFERLGFVVIDKSELPNKIWSDCLNCVHFPNCNEIAMIHGAKSGESA